jgi:Tol biopolymer transport system component/DNA-binding winged helix-turn-helix (wHTH) protein
MATQPPSPQVVRFGVFEVDLQARELRKSGVKLKLHDQPFQVLGALIERPGEVVTREELRQKLWREDTFVDFDHSLNTAVNKLREVLGDSADSPRFIETVPRRGYRFLGGTENLGGSAAAAHVSGRRRMAWWAGAAALLLLLIGGAAWLRFVDHSSEAATATLRMTPMTGYGWEGAPSFSPDGNQVTFGWNGPRQDNEDIYVKLIGTASLLRLTTSAAADWNPAWSPDGRFIAFLRSLEGGKTLVILVPALGGPERKLAEICLTGAESIQRSLTWSPDSKQIIVVSRRVREEPTGLFLLSVETGEKRSLISPAAKSIGDRDPAFSPDGRTLAFIRSPSYGIGDLYLLALSEDFMPSGEPKRLTFDNRDVIGPAWTPDGREIVFSSDRLGTRHLWRLAVLGSAEPRLIAFVGDDAMAPAISRRRLAYVQHRRHRDIWQVAVPGPGGIASPPVTLISSRSDHHNPQYSPDGKKVAFSSDRSGSHEIWVSDSDGSNGVRLTSFGGPVTDRASWSPDGKKIAFHSRPEGQAEIYVINSEGGRPQRLTYEQADDVAPSWSHDGKWIYFGSNRTGIHQVWKMPSGGGPAVQVTKNGGIVALESPDGKYLYYTKVRGFSSLWKVPVEGGPESEILESLFYVNFAVRPEGIYFIGKNGSSLVSSPLQLLSFTGGVVKTIVPREMLGEAERTLVDTFGVSPDGRSILFARWSSEERELVLVENFR